MDRNTLLRKITKITTDINYPQMAHACRVSLQGECRNWLRWCEGKYSMKTLKLKNEQRLVKAKRIERKIILWNLANPQYKLDYTQGQKALLQELEYND